MEEMLSDIGLSLDAVAKYAEEVPYWAVIAGLCVVCSTVADDVRDRYLLHFWLFGAKRKLVQLTFLAGWGGGLTSAILLARPVELPVNMFANRHDIMIVLIWWLANYFPLGGPGYVIRWRPVQLLATVLLQLSRASTMAFVMSLTAKHHPNASIGVVIMGCIGGSGGKVLHDMLRGGYAISKASDEISVPGMGLHSSMAGAAMYYWLVIVQGVLTQRQGKAFLLIFLGVHSLIAEVTGWNILSPIVTAVHTILNVPQPMTLAAARKVAPAESTSANSKKRN